MSTPESQDADNKPALPANAAVEATTVPPQDRPAVSTSAGAKGSTPSPDEAAAGLTTPDSGATGPHLAGGGASWPPMSGPRDGLAPQGPGGEGIPGHEMLGVLGRGGMGVVYKARHLRLKRLVAVKMILAGEHAGPDDLARFRTEAEAIARLQHPNIVQVFEVSEQEGRPFFSLEFCGGGSLAKKLAGTPLPPREAAALVQTLAEAMQAAHSRGVIHRDLKPANVLLTEDGTPKITDFGLAKKLDEAGQTVSGAVMGTPSYMAPEQAESKEVGPLADVYALGAVLYECLTGRPPFKAATSLDTILQVISEEPVPPRRLNPAMPRDLETVCLKCLQKEPARRYDSAQALADDLQRFLKQEPILARPATARERVAKWCRRNPRVALLIGLVGASVLAYAVTVTWLSVNLSEQTRIAKDNEKVARDGQMKAFAHVVSVAQSALTRHLRQPTAEGALPLQTVRKRAVDDVRKELKALAEEMKLRSFNQVAVHQQAGDFARNIGLLRDALTEYRQGYDLMKGITEEDPEYDVARGNMAAMLLRLGNVAWEMNGDVNTARKHFDEARALRQEVTDHPRGKYYSSQQNEVALAYSALDLGRLELSQGHLAAARKHMDQSLQARRAWAQAPPPEDQNMAPSHLSEACMWMGVILAHQGNQEGADKFLQEAAGTDRRARQETPRRTQLPDGPRGNPRRPRRRVGAARRLGRRLSQLPGGAGARDPGWAARDRG